MANPELGTKQVCPNCQAKFYDLNRRPAHCPKCDAEFDPDYLAWRDEQLRSHDQDYAAWRAEQHRKYDAEYRVFRGARQDEFGRSFTDWRSQRDAQDPLTGPVSEGEPPPEDKV